MKKKLFIIGNGFDLHHSLPTSFAEFKTYVSKENSILNYYLENYFTGDLWSDFEESLVEFNINLVLDDNLELLPNDSDKSGDMYIFPDKMEEIINTLTIGLKNSLRDWILQIKPRENPQNLLLNQVETNSFFLTFNYSDTLEKYYNIPNEKILHIHNIARKLNFRLDEVGYLDDNSEIIIGHSFSHKSKMKKNDLQNIKGLNRFAYNSGKELLIPYFGKSFKDTKQIIYEHSSFLNSEFENIEVIGHSLSNVDLPYFAELHKNNPSANWLISYFNDKELKKMKNQTNQFKRDLKNVKYHKI